MAAAGAGFADGGGAFFFPLFATCAHEDGVGVGTTGGAGGGGGGGAGVCSGVDPEAGAGVEEGTTVAKAASTLLKLVLAQADVYLMLSDNSSRCWACCSVM